MAQSIATARPLVRSLAGRLVALALAQLAIIAAGGLVIAWLLRPPAPRDLGALIDAAATAIEPALGGSDADVRSALDDAARTGGLEASLWAPDGRLRASTVDPPLRDGPAGPHRHGPHGPPPPRGLFDVGPPPPAHSITLHDGHRLSVRPARPPPVYLGMLLTLLIGVLVLGAGGVLTARWILAPLDTLRKTARSIANGELTARTGLSRPDEIGEVARAFDEMAIRIERLLRKERELLANVSHELRTPLSRIKVALDLADEGHASSKAALEGVAADVEELETIVESVLSAARMERAGPGGLDAGLPASSLREVATADLAETAASRFRAAHPDRPLTLELDGVLRPLLADPLLVRRVLANLLENAHKYSPDPASPIVLRGRSLEGEVELEIVDHGLGIEPEDLPHVFEPFFRAEKSRSRQAGGVGLGLTLSKRIVEAHGGTLTLESEPGKGTIAHVRLPTASRTDGR